jgi:hypothetical protein
MKSIFSIIAGSYGAAICQSLSSAPNRIDRPRLQGCNGKTPYSRRATFLRRDDFPTFSSPSHDLNNILRHASSEKLVRLIKASVFETDKRKLGSIEPRGMLRQGVAANLKNFAALEHARKTHRDHRLIRPSVMVEERNRAAQMNEISSGIGEFSPIFRKPPFGFG